MKRALRLALALLVGALAVGNLAACSPAQNPNDGRIHIVSSLAVWGDIADSIGGNEVSVISLINNISQDPHSYEATAQDQLAIEKADIVVYSSYDTFMVKLLDTAKVPPIKRIDVSIRDLTAYMVEPDPHLWMQQESAAYLAQQLVTKFSALDKKHAADYASRLGTFNDKLQKTFAQAFIPNGLPATGVHFIATEPIATPFLTRYFKLVDATPAAMTQAAVNETDMSPATLLEVRKLILGAPKTVQLFVYNEQVRSAQTDQLLALAKQHGMVPLAFSEVLPKQLTYLQWMDNNFASTQSALQAVADHG